MLLQRLLRVRFRKDSQRFREDAMMDLDLKSASILRALIYPIQFESKPVEGINRVLRMVVFADHLKLQVPDVIAAIDAGLDSNASLSELIPQGHTEAVIRSFLAAVRTRLECEPPMKRT
jgi:hypothetical protein